MIGGIRLKVCGLTSLVDAEWADRSGADYLGFILYPKSPRFVSLETYRAMAARLPDRRKVAVSVEPTGGDLAAMRAVGFDYFQIHFRPETEEAMLAEWSAAVGRERLWLAPKLPPERDVSDATRAAAKFVLLDTFHAEGFGGSGRPGDWGKFARHRSAYPETRWVLAGGLNPENIGEAVRQSGATFVDVNSGIEASPGVKDVEKLRRLAAALQHAARPPTGA